ncbi:hypothetical protein [Aeromicrobium sp. Root472D3]|uniref:hypothetical protein n=1 Tax=Aeromicrobium sp. Root472D3 TaxID=1736540 RepID=UPI0006F8BDDF|nr:hypothetical protein [Aeromicrobium sp. Root472D3]KQX71822.1 hypothetical protein ASD10_17850 [Aeromicrobium sp. Root472D3]
MVTIPARFNGPDHSGNGGYVAGMLAAEVGSDVVTSTLRVPPPLDVPLSWEHDAHHDGEVVRLLTAGGALVGEAAPGAFTRDAPAAPTSAEAAAGLAAYRGHDEHPFDRCFTCGTARGAGDGLRLFTGPVGDDRVAASWTPDAAFGAPGDGRLDVPTTWAALDCPGGWAADFTRQTMVLGRMTAQVVRAPRAGEPLVSVGVLHERDGRKFRTDTALHTADGELLGRAEQVWIQVEHDAFR